MIREVTMYQAVCDRCDATDEQDDYYAWADADQAESQVLDSEWTQIDGRLLCPDCTCWSDDETELVEKPPAEVPA